MTNNESPQSVNHLLELAREGRDDAFNEIAKKYRPLIDSIVCYFFAQAEREELEQEALIGLYRAACSYDPSVSSVSFGLYAKIVITNTLLTFVRNEFKRQGNYLEKNDGFDVDSVDTSDPSDDYINKESFLKLDKFVKEHLSDYEYAVYRMYVEGYRIKEIAARLSKTEKSVDGAIVRFKIKMRNCIKTYDL